MSAKAVSTVTWRSVAKTIRKQVTSVALDQDLSTRFFPNGEAFEVLENVANELADSFAATNPRFNRETFLKNCGVL